MRVFLSLVLALFAGSLMAQQASRIGFLDYNTQEPIPGVFVYNQQMTASMLSDDKGVVVLAAFQPTDTIVITHSGYHTKTMVLNDTNSFRAVVYLKRKTIFLDEFTIAANKRQLKKSDVPNRIEIISADQIQMTNPQTSADLLALSGQVYVQKSQLGGGSPMIRGFSANRVLLVVDGVRMNNAIFRSGNLQNSISIDPHVVERTEVIYGPGSVIYGSDALGGVVEYFTKNPDYAMNDSVEVHGSFLTRYSTANREKTQHFDVSIASEKVAFLSSFSYSSFSDLRAGTRGGDDAYLRPWYQVSDAGEDKQIANSDPNLQVNSGFNQMFFSQKVNVKVGKLDLRYGLHFANTSDIPRYDRLVQESGSGAPRNAEWHYGPQEWLMNSLNVSTESEGRVFGAKLYDRLSLVAAHQRFEESRIDRKFNDPSRRTRTETVSAWSLNLDLDRSINELQNLYYGVEFVDNAVGSIAERTDISTGAVEPTSTRYPDGSKYQTVSAYMSYTNKLSEDLNLTAGLRYSNVHTRAEFDSTTYGFPFQSLDDRLGAVSGSAGLAYRLNSSYQLNANFATGFRAPNIDDLAKVFDSEPGNVVVPNPDLLPEYTYNFDLGVYANPYERLGFELSAYATYLDNALVRTNYSLNGQDSVMYDGEMSRVQALTNADFATVFGVYGRVRFDWSDRLSFETMYTYNMGEDSEGNPLRHASPGFGSTHVIYSTHKIKLNFSALYNGALSNDQLAPSEQNKAYLYASDTNGDPYSPAWLTLNARATWFMADHVSLDFAIENITDELYRTYSSGISAPGRNVIFALRAWL